MDRRNLLRAAVAAPAVPLLTGSAAEAAEKVERDTTSRRFALAVLPDTQYLFDADSAGRPFVIGATSFDLAYGQGFYGSIGDVRITTRALRPADFLTRA